MADNNEKTAESIDINEKEDKKLFKKSLLIALAAAAIILGSYLYIDSSKYVSTDDAYIESHMVSVAPRVSGPVVEIYITDNQKIREGDIIAKIDDTDYRVKYEQANAQYTKALLAQNVAKANLGAVNSEISLAKKDLDRYSRLYSSGAVSKQVLDMAQTKYDALKAKQTTAEEGILSKSSNKVADADLRTLKALRDQAENYLEYTNIRATRTGTVTNKKIEKGAFVAAGQPLFAVVPDEIWVVANFKENQLEKMKKGQSVDIKVDAYPNMIFKGTVDSIQRSSGAKASLFPPENAVGSFVKIVQRVPVKIIFNEKIDHNEYNIVSGMSVVPKVRVK